MTTTTGEHHASAASAKGSSAALTHAQHSAEARQRMRQLLAALQPQPLAAECPSGGAHAAQTANAVGESHEHSAAANAAATNASAKNATIPRHTLLSAPSFPFPTGRIYGGQLLAQSILAAAATVAPDRLPHSMHAYFLEMGNTQQNVQFDVLHRRDGFSFSTRQVEAIQHNNTIYEALLNFQRIDAEGPNNLQNGNTRRSAVDYADPLPAHLPEPESLRSDSDYLAPYVEQSAFARYVVEQSPFDIRHVEAPLMLGIPARGGKSSAEHHSAGEAHRTGKQIVWMRMPALPTGISQTLQRALLALGCDQVMMEPVLRRAALSITTPGIAYASLDHAMWWYRDIDMSQWHVYVQDTPTAAQDRGLGTAHVYTARGELAAVITQEALVRAQQ